ncbi:hypothetical protein H0H93_004176 [Arthromyces matolae]|nr:hypothetical protein H0H93_004176 [Arthromyces matolae]
MVSTWETELSELDKLVTSFSGKKCPQLKTAPFKLEAYKYAFMWEKYEKAKAERCPDNFATKEYEELGKKIFCRRANLAQSQFYRRPGSNMPEICQQNYHIQITHTPVRAQRINNN